MATNSEHSFRRCWPDRHDDRVHVFANGHVYDKAERRESLRALIRIMRHERAWALRDRQER